MLLNDLTGLDLAGIEMPGSELILFGNPVTLRGDVVGGGLNTVAMPLELTAGDHTFDGQIITFASASPALAG